MRRRRPRLPRRRQTWAADGKDASDSWVAPWWALSSQGGTARAVRVEVEGRRNGEDKLGRSLNRRPNLFERALGVNWGIYVTK